jgi:Ser/Thr protein kinase RdoA (MazF antagonist)
MLSRALARRLAEELPRRYPHWGAIRTLDAVGGGFSGASLFRVASAGGAHAVKLSPVAGDLVEATNARHRVIEQLAADGDQPVFPRLQRDASGATLWTLHARSETLMVEARDWLEDAEPGVALSLVDRTPAPSSRDSPARIASAFELLVRFHDAGNRVGLTDQERTYLKAPTPLPERYVHEWRQAASLNLAAVEAATVRLPLDLREPARDYLFRLPAIAARIAPSFASLPGTSPPLRLCLRDAHRNNMAYSADVARAFFDWDAMRFDRRVGDFARLAASFGLNADEAENLILSALEAVSPIDKWTAWESAALHPVLATQVWLPPLNWLKWLLVEERTFDDPAAAFARLRETLNLSILRSFSIGDA